MSGRKWAGVLTMIVALTPLLAVGQSNQNQPGLLTPDSEAKEEKRGFRPGKFIGKLIPGGKDRDERRSAETSGPRSGADGAVVVPNPANSPVVAPPPFPQPEMTPRSGGRVPPPPVPSSAENVKLSPPPSAAPPANPFESGAGSAEEDRGILGGVANMVGKIIPGGRDNEPTPVAEGNERTGLIGRMLDRRKGDENVVGPDPIILPSRPAPAPVATETAVPAAAVAMSRPVAAPEPESGDLIHQQRLTIPLRSGNPDAPVQREEREATSDTVAMSRSTIDPVMPASQAGTAAPSDPVAIKAPPADSIPMATPEPTQESITPSIPASTLATLPPAVAPVPAPESTIVIPSTQKSTGLMISDSGNSAPSPAVTEAESTPAPVAVATTPPTEDGAVAWYNGKPTSAIAAIEGPSKEVAESPSQPAVSPSAPTETQTAKAKVEATAEATVELPASSAGVHFVTIKEGVAGAWRDSSGQGQPLASGTVMRFLGGDEKLIKVRLEGGAEGAVETWQIRDATFEEAVDFLKRAN